MKQRFEVSSSTSLADFWRSFCLDMKQDKEAQELYAAFDVVQIWKSYFEGKYGALQAITHYSNPDDPPDVMAHFEREDLSIEHTFIEPSHLKKADALHHKDGKGRSRNGVPVSVLHLNKKSEFTELMYGAGVWESATSALEVRAEILRQAVESKVKKYPVGGVLILEASFVYHEYEVEALKSIFESLADLPGLDCWTLVFRQRDNHLQFFSTLFSLREGFEIKSQR